MPKIGFDDKRATSEAARRKSFLVLSDLLQQLFLQFIDTLNVSLYLRYS
jgi:hypothetical protein